MRYSLVLCGVAMAIDIDREASDGQPIYVVYFCAVGREASAAAPTGYLATP